MQDTLEVLNPAIVNPNFQPLGRSYCCDIHRDGQQFCQTCCTPVCADCAFQLHRNHVTVDLKNTVELACVQADQMLQETRRGISTLREELDEVQVSYPLRNSFITDIIKYDNDSLHREYLILLCRYLLQKLNTDN